MQKDPHGQIKHKCPHGETANYEEVLTPMCASTCRNAHRIEEKLYLNEIQNGEQQNPLQTGHWHSEENGIHKEEADSQNGDPPLLRNSDKLDAYWLFHAYSSAQIVI